MSDVLLVGATGLVGGEVLKRWRGPKRLVPLARRSIGAVPELVEPDIRRWPDLVEAQAPQAVICTLGTTIRRAGSQDAFAAIDRDLVRQVAKAARRAGARQFLVVSSAMADPKARNFYLRTKGEMEEALHNLGFARLDILRPGLIRGDRAERRPMERLAAVVSPLFDPLLIGRFREVRSFPADSLAEALIALVGQGQEGEHIHRFDALTRLSTAKPR